MIVTASGGRRWTVNRRYQVRASVTSGKSIHKINVLASLGLSRSRNPDISKSRSNASVSNAVDTRPVVEKDRQVGSSFRVRARNTVLMNVLSSPFQRVGRLEAKRIMLEVWLRKLLEKVRVFRRVPPFTYQMNEPLCLGTTTFHGPASASDLHVSRRRASLHRDD